MPFRIWRQLEEPRKKSEKSDFLSYSNTILSKHGIMIAAQSSYYGFKPWRGTRYMTLYTIRYAHGIIYLLQMWGNWFGYPDNRRQF